jgi:predicted lipoprotein with Yx(FWY)xxD motif
MRRVALLAVAFTLAALVVTACDGNSMTTLSTPPTTDAGLTLTVQHSPDGLILATGTGYTLYDFAPDSPHHSTCLDDGCVYQWPPLLLSGPLRVGPGVERSLVGTLARPGGTQLSYGGHPLYTYTLDTKPGVIMGQAIDQNGGPWYVLTPAGQEIHTPFSVEG